MEFFWKQQDDIPAGMGYPLFGPAHLASVAITLAVVALLTVGFLRLSRKTQDKCLKALPLFMIAMEICKDLFLVSVHRFGIGYLPLHVCSIGIFVFLFREWLPFSRAKEILGEIAFVLIMPASVAGLVFADWTTLYPILNFMNMYSYVWHGLLILYPVLIKKRGDISPSIRHIHYVLLFLCAIVPPIYAFDKHFGCNYFFINWPIPCTPLMYLAEILGNPGYLLGYGSLVLTVILLIYAIIGIFSNKKP